MNHPLAACIVISMICCCRLANAQADEPEQLAGLLLGSPLGITHDQHLQIQLKLAGFTPGIPPTWPPGLPRPQFEKLVADILPNVGTAGSPILAMSLGIDVIVVADGTLSDGASVDGNPAGPEPFAALSTAPHGWYAIEFSVDGDVLAPGDELAPDVQIAVAAQEVDASVFTYVLPMSTTVLLPPENQSVRSLDPASLGLAARDRIQALNLHMGLYHTDLALYPNVFTERPLPQQVWVYFTLSDVAVTKYGQSIATTWGVPQPDSGTIYRTNWVGGSWTKPVVYRIWQQLGIEPPPGAGTPILDGLAIDTNAPDDEWDDEIMFSLAHTETYSVPAAMQMLYAQPVSANPPPLPPRRVVVKLPDGDEYGTLGLRMGAGRGIGDFCTGDPWHVTKLNTYALKNLFLLDDFFVARRLAPDVAYVLPAVFVVPPAAAAVPSLLPAFRHQETKPFRRWLRQLFAQRHRLFLPGGTEAIELPELALAISGFRQHQDQRRLMRVCASWPRPTAATGTATFHWGTTDNVFANPPVFRWDGSETQPYRGRPLTFEKPLLDDGVLLPSPANSPGPNRMKAFVVKWTLATENGTYVSPVAALRY